MSPKVGRPDATMPALNPALRQDRAKWLDEQIKAAEEQFEHAMKRLKQEHGSAISGLRFELNNIKAVLELEERRFN